MGHPSLRSYVDSMATPSNGAKLDNQFHASASSYLVYTDFIRAADLELARTYKDGTTQVVKLKEGPTGFAVAVMRECVVSTEIVALALAPI